MRRIRYDEKEIIPVRGLLNGEIESTDITELSLMKQESFFSSRNSVVFEHDGGEPFVVEKLELFDADGELTWMLRPRFNFILVAGDTLNITHEHHVSIYKAEE